MSINGWYPGIEQADALLRKAGHNTVTTTAIQRREQVWHARVCQYTAAEEAVLEADTPTLAGLFDDDTAKEIGNLCRRLGMDYRTACCIRYRLQGWTVAELATLTDLSMSAVKGRLRRAKPRIARAIDTSPYASLWLVKREAHMYDLRSNYPLDALKRAKKRPRR